MIMPAPERFVVPMAAFLALGAFTWTQGDPAVRSESAFLTLLTASLLAVIAALEARTPAAGSTSAASATALLATSAREYSTSMRAMAPNSPRSPSVRGTCER